MRGFTIPLGAPFTAAVAAWLTQNYPDLHAVTVWLPNQKTRADLTKNLARHGVRRLPRLRLLRAEDPDVTAPAPHVLSQPGLCALVANLSANDAQMAQTGALTSLYGQQLSVKGAEWSQASATARHLRQMFDRLDTTLTQTGRGTLAASTVEALATAATTPGPHVVAGLLDAQGAALDFLRALAAHDDSVFIFPDLPLPTTPPILASHPGAALARLMGTLNLTQLEPLPGVTAAPPAMPQLAVAPHPLAEATAIAQHAKLAIAEGQTPIHILCPDAALRDLIAAALRTYNMAYQGEGPRLARTPAGQLYLALAQAAAAPEPTALAALSRALNLNPLLDAALWRGVPSETWGDWATKLGALDRDDIADADRPALTESFTTLRNLVESLGDPRPPTDWCHDILDTLKTSRPDFAALPGAPTLERWLANIADAPITNDWSATAWADFVAQQFEVQCLPASTTGEILLTGLLEARLLSAGSVIIADANEGAWPATPATPLLSDNDCERLGLPGPRQQLRLTAAEFYLALHAAPNVLIIRSTANAQGASRPSRFLQGLKIEPANITFTLPAPTRTPLPHAGVFVPGEELLAPDWSASWVEDLAQCPYRAVGKRRLQLKELPPYHADPTDEHHGLWVHKWLGEFWPEWKKSNLNEQEKSAAEELLLKLGQRELRRQPDIIRRLWQGRLPALAAQVVAHWLGREVLHTELKLEGRAGSKKLTARADRIDSTPDGWRIVDYKTGGVPNWAEVGRGEKPQLLIETILAQQSGQPVAGVEYVQLRGHGAKLVKPAARSVAQLADATAQTGPWLEALAVRYAPQKTFAAAPVYGGGLQPRGHCERCSLGGICRWAESTPEGKAP